MTTAKHRQPATAAGPRRGASEKQSERTEEPIPVLIRLPKLSLDSDLGSESDSTAAGGVVGDAARATIPLRVSLPNSGLPAGSPADVPPSAASDAGGESAGATGISAASQRIPLWSVFPGSWRLGQTGQRAGGRRRSQRFAFSVSRQTLRAAMAVGLIVILVTAYLVISSGSPPPGAPEAEEELASVVESPATVLASAGSPAASPSPLVSQSPAVSQVPAASQTQAPAPSPAEPQSPALQGAPASSASDAAPDAVASAEAVAVAVKETAKPEKSPIETPPQVAAGGGAKPSAAGDSASAGSPATPASGPGQPQARTSPEETRPAEPVLGPASSTPLNAPAEPLTAEATASNADAAGGEVYSYPVTNPATFQYPVDYHERLQPQTRSGASPNARPAPSGAGVSDRPPSTARLQPRIEPPPVR